MKVKCIANNGTHLRRCNISSDTGYTIDSKFLLTVGKEYTVYGITIEMGSLWYYVTEDIFNDNINNVRFPIWRPSELFEVIDNRISKTWVVGCLDFGIEGLVPILTFPEWANNHWDYYDRLADGEEEAFEVFMKYKEIMDTEFD